LDGIPDLPETIMPGGISLTLRPSTFVFRFPDKIDDDASFDRLTTAR